MRFAELWIVSLETFWNIKNNVPADQYLSFHPTLCSFLPQLIQTHRTTAQQLAFAERPGKGDEGYWARLCTPSLRAAVPAVRCRDKTTPFCRNQLQTTQTA